MPNEYDYQFTREALRAKEPILYEGAAFYGLHGCEDLHCNTGGMIFKSKSGKVVVIDGGRPAETDSDIVQVGHHGCGNVSDKCYELIDADAYIWLIGEKFWYSDCGEGLNTHNTGVIRTRAYMMRNNPKIENIHVAMDDIISLPLPIKIH